jgi:hypothetical protein
MSNPEELLRGLLDQLTAMEAETRVVLAGHEAAAARVITLEQSYGKLTSLSLDQDELFREAFRAVESDLFRAAHVLAWAGFIDWLHNYLLPDNQGALATVQPKWPLASPEDLRDQADFQVIEAAKRAGVIGKTQMKALHGLLNRRNECAHPSGHFPDLNQTLGYISELLGRIEKLDAARATP